MSFRAFFLASSLLLLTVTHASPSLALQFTQDSFVFNAGHPRANTTVELSNIDPAAQSFELKAFGSIAESFRPSGEFTWTSQIHLAFNASGPSFPDITSVSILDSTLPAGGSAGFSLAEPEFAQVFVEFPFPPPMDPFSWSATFKLTTTGLLGNYDLFQVWGSEFCDPPEPCDGGGIQSDDVFGLAIVPEPSAALVAAVGLVIVSQAVRRAGRR